MVIKLKYFRKENMSEKYYQGLLFVLWVMKEWFRGMRSVGIDWLIGIWNNWFHRMNTGISYRSRYILSFQIRFFFGKNGFIYGRLG